MFLLFIHTLAGSLLGAPGSERLSISSVLGTATAGGVHLVCYTLLPPGKGEPAAGSQRAREHRLRERTLLFDIELSCAPPANEAQK